MSNESDGRGTAVSVLAGIGIGVLVGAAAGLLLAPKSGDETRDTVSASLTDLSERVSELGKTVANKVATAVDKTRQTMAQKMNEMPGDGEGPSA